MSRVLVHGCGAVSPAGWGMESLRGALAAGVALPTSEIARPGWGKPLTVRKVPAPASRPAFLAHARLRRASPISHYVVAAALEALGGDADLIAKERLRLGIVLCVMSGCVNYSRRFYDEALRDPATASPLLFPETVFNAPASHLASLLGTPAMNYTLVGDPGTFLQGLVLGAQWLTAGQVDGCLVVGAEETDWTTANAFRLFSRRFVLADGAGALYLKREAEGAKAELGAVTGSHLFGQRQSRAQAANRCRVELPACSDTQVLADGLQDVPRMDAAEAAAWRDWTAARVSPKRLLGEALMAAAAWQCAAAVDSLQSGGCDAASVSVVGCNQQAIGAHLLQVRMRSQSVYHHA